MSRLSPLRTALLTALGLTPFTACGGATSAPGDEASTGGKSGNEASTGGKSGNDCVPVDTTQGGAKRLPCHRPAPVECASSLPRAGNSASCMIQSGEDDCRTDADCTAKPNGLCEGPPGSYKCSCSYGCRTDADCNAEEVCFCGDPVGRCVSSTCTVDADCGKGLFCLTYTSGRECVYPSFSCQTPQDTCVSHDDCPLTQVCTPYPDGVRKCQPGGCPVPGRPFLVGGAARVAPTTERTDWTSSLTPDTAGLSDAERATLSDRWAEIGAMEHASVAAFARFALELLSLGAPASLLEETQRAIADELGHARDAYALASVYAGRSLGPGCLRVVTDSLGGRTPETILETAIREGCVGETVAAAEAAEALAAATDPAVRAALVRVVEEETRHAALSYRFVLWVLNTDALGLRQTALAALASILDAELATSRDAAGAPAASPGLVAHGYVANRERHAVRERALRDVVAPCMRALVGAGRRGTSAVVQTGPAALV